MLPLRACRQRGITLIEIILVCAIVVAATTAIFVFAKKTSVTAAVKTEQRQIEDIVKTVDGLFATQPNFAALGTNGSDGAQYLAAHAKRAGLSMTQDSDGNPVLRTGLGGGKGTLVLASTQLGYDADPGKPDNAFVLTYEHLTPSECVGLVTSTASLTTKTHVALANAGSPATRVSLRGQLDKDKGKIAALCNPDSGEPAVSLYFASARAIAAPTPPAPPPAARCNPVHERQDVACPAGQVGSITQERDGTCTGPGNSMVYTAWSTTGNTCQTGAVTPPTVTPPPLPDNCALVTTTRVQACPAGQIGQRVEQSQQDTCAGTSTPWTQISDSCQVPPPVGTCTPSTESRTMPCSAGQTGTITQTRSSSCDSLPPDPDWSAWETISSTCQGIATCQPQREEGPIPCAAGSTGPASGSRERYRTCTDATTAGAWSTWTTLVPNTACVSCPAPQTKIWGCPAGSPGASGGGHIWLERTYDCVLGKWGPYAEVANTCWGLPCSLPVPNIESQTQTRTATQTLACPAGQSGAITQERTEQRTQTRTASCISAIAYDWSAWSAWSTWSATTAWATTSNTCAGNCVVPTPSTETQTDSRNATQSVSCPAGQTGAINQERPETRTRTRSASCPTTTGPVSWSGWSAWTAWTAAGSWVTTSNTCAANCVVPTPSTETQTDSRNAMQSVSCPAGQTGTINQERPETRTRTRSASCPTTTGPVAWSGWSAWSAWTAAGSWVTTSSTCVGNCVVPTPSTETQTDPRTGTRTLDCAAGQYGTHTQSRPEIRTRTRIASCPTTTGPVSWTAWSAWTAWSGTSAWTTTVNTCTNCGSTSDTRVVWQPRSQACPTGQTGSHTWEEQRNQSRTGTYSCPAGTTTLPAPSWGAWINGSWTGTKRNEGNTCTVVKWYDRARINGYCEPRDVPICPNSNEAWFLEVDVGAKHYFIKCGNGPLSVCPDPDTMTIDDFEEGYPEDLGYV